MKIILTLLCCCVGFAAMAQQSVDTTKTRDTSLMQQDTLRPPARTYKVDMSKYNRDTTKWAAPNFQQPYYDKRLESNYQYENGKVSGGSTQFKIGKKKKN